MEVLRQDMIPVPDDALDAVAGGEGWSLCGNYCSSDECEKINLCSPYGG